MGELLFHALIWLLFTAQPKAPTGASTADSLAPCRTEDGFRIL